MFLQGLEWRSEANGIVQFAENCDFQVDHIVREETKKEDCGELCYRKIGCNLFLWVPNQEKSDIGTCTLKRGYATAMETKNNGICGQISTEKLLLVQIVGQMLEEPTPDTLIKNPEFNSNGSPCDKFTKIASHFSLGRGDSSYRNDFPWMAALYSPKEFGIAFRCAGVIISDYHILSAAHCFEDIQPSIVRLGTQILTQNTKTDLKVQVVFIIGIGGSCSKHPNYSSQTRKNDIGVVKLEQRIIFSTKILPACLRHIRSDLPLSQVLVSTGWGTIETDHIEPSNFLRKKQLRTVELRTCQENYLKGRTDDKNYIDESQYCATDLYGQVDVSKVDSGGVLQIISNSPLATVVGLASWNSSYHKVYTRFVCLFLCFFFVSKLVLFVFLRFELIIPGIKFKQSKGYSRTNSQFEIERVKQDFHFDSISQEEN
ncbi:Serine protease snake [Pseudolycoriella hygida]|uniref:Serine protease snake n=1 Tax=Pseudolycoriella hygida TaxID=35572 RepID=A0A9Q0N583_9DIPT|nr:Serine protease snake [Pseudolycoriella hygida]